MHSAWLRSSFVRVLKFLQVKEWGPSFWGEPILQKVKEGGPNFWGEPILQRLWIIWSSLLYLKFKSFVDPISSSFVRFQCILHNWRVLLSESWNFYKLKKGDLVSGGDHFYRKSKLFGPPFCISISKVLWTQIHCNLLDSMHSA